MTANDDTARARIVEDIAGDATAAALLSRGIPFTRTGQNELDIRGEGRLEDLDLISDALILAAATTAGSYAWNRGRGLRRSARLFKAALANAHRIAREGEPPRPPRTGLIGLALFGLGLAALIIWAAARIGGAG